MRSINPACRFYFDNYIRIDDEVGDVSADYFAAELDLEWELPFNGMASATQHDRHCIGVDALEKPFAQFAVHFKKSADNDTRELTMRKRFEVGG